MKKKKVIAQQALGAFLATAIAGNSFSFTGLSTVVNATENIIDHEINNNKSQKENLDLTSNETTDNEVEEKVLNEEKPEEAAILYSGTDGALDWSIDENGLLMITGNGDRDLNNTIPQWCLHSSSIKEAKLNISNITNMRAMFYDCSALTELDLSNFDTSKVTNMRELFYGCNSLTKLDLSNFDTSKVTNMRELFNECSALTELDLSNFNTSKVTNMSYMFNGCSGLTELDLSNIDTSKVTNMSNMFNGCSSLTELDLSKLDTSHVTNMEAAFSSCSSLTELDLSQLDTSNATNISFLFASNSGLKTLDLSKLNTSKVTNMGGIFNCCDGLISVNLNGLDTSNVTDMGGMFGGCSSLTELDLSPLDTSNVTNMDGMFNGCSSLTELDLSPLDTSNVTSMWQMFYCCNGLTELDLSPLDTSKVTTMKEMFGYCHVLKTLNLSNLNTSNVIRMSYMFEECSGLTELDLSSFDTSKVLEMQYMFEECSGLTKLDVSNFDTSQVTEMQSMFEKCSGLTELDVSNFNTSNVTDIRYMFHNCDGLTEIDLSNWDLSNITLAEEADKLFNDSFKKITVPANIKITMKLPETYDGDYWYNENNEICTKIATNLTKPMTYTRFVVKNIENTEHSIIFEDNLLYSGDIQERTFRSIIKLQGQELIEGTDYNYTVTGNTGKDAGDYKLKITITGIGNYTGELIIEKDWSIAKAPKAPNAPKDSCNAFIKDGLKIKDIPLDDYPNWQWIETDWQTTLPTKAGETFDTIAEYVGSDAANYETITQPVTITMLHAGDNPSGGDNKPTTGGAIEGGDNKPTTGGAIEGGDNKPTTGGAIEGGDNKPTTGGAIEGGDNKPTTGGAIEGGDNKPTTGGAIEGGDNKPTTGGAIEGGDNKPSTGEENKPSDSNTNTDTNNTGSTVGGSTNNGGNSIIITTPSTNTTDHSTTQPPKTEQEPIENDNNSNNDISTPSTDKPNTTTETKADGTIVETTTQTTENGNNVTTITETKTDGSITETKKVITDNNDAVLTITKETTQQGTNTNAVISTGKQGNITIPEKLLNAISEDKNINGYVVEITPPTIAAAQKRIKNTIVTVNLSSTDNVRAEDIVLTQDSIQTAKETGKGLKIIVTTKNDDTTSTIESSEPGINNNYTVTIPAKQLSKINNSVETVSITISVNSQKDKVNHFDTSTELKTALTNSGSKANKTCVISTAKNKTLDNVGIKLQVDVTKAANVKAGNQVYLYKYNAETGKLEEIANSKQTVASDGTVSIEGYSGTDYVVSAKKLTGNSVITIKDSIRLNMKKTSIKQGKKLTTVLKLPNMVSTKNKFGTEKATVVYKSKNPKIASISKKGVITAKKKGKAAITAIVKLESGQKISKTKKIIIK